MKKKTKENKKCSHKQARVTVNEISKHDLSKKPPSNQLSKPVANYQ